MNRCANDVDYTALLLLLMIYVYIARRWWRERRHARTCSTRHDGWRPTTGVAPKSYELVFYTSWRVACALETRTFSLCWQLCLYMQDRSCHSRSNFGTIRFPPVALGSLRSRRATLQLMYCNTADSCHFSAYRREPLLASVSHYQDRQRYTLLLHEVALYNVYS